jgi:hypothetical protein
MAELFATSQDRAALSRNGGSGVLSALAGAVLFAAAVLTSGMAQAVEAIPVDPDEPKIDITAKGELYEGRGDRLQIETAPGPDGYIGRMAVGAPLFSGQFTCVLARA